MLEFFGGAFVYLVLSSLVGVFANRKGRSEAGWILWAIVISPLLAFIIVAILPPIQENIEKQAMKEAKAVKCPFCAEMIKPEAIVCKHCGRDLPAKEEPAA